MPYSIKIWHLKVMLKIMKPANYITSGTFILLWCVLHWTCHTPFCLGNCGPHQEKWCWDIKVGVHFLCFFMTILSHFAFIIFNMNFKMTFTNPPPSILNIECHLLSPLLIGMGSIGKILSLVLFAFALLQKLLVFKLQPAAF